jgi:hypothetical protein
MKIGTESTRLLAAGLAASGAAATLLLAACHPPHIHSGARGRDWFDRPMKVGAVLTCPQTQGSLNRTAQAGDGQSCNYTGAAGEQVELKRLVLAGQSPQAALGATETALQTLVPAHQRSVPLSFDAGDSGEHAKIDLPGIHINAQGDKAQVKVFGIVVDANGENANVNVGAGSSRTVVQAGPDGAEIRVTDIGPTNVKLAYVLAGGQRPGPSPYRAVGYLARGPLDGPLVVVTFKATDSHEDWRGDHDLNALLALNVKQ